MPLIQFFGSGMEKCAPLRGSIRRLFRIRLDDAAARVSDLVQGPLHGGRSDPPAAVLRVREDAADPPVGQNLRFRVVGPPALDVGKFRRGAELTPADTSTVVVDQYLAHRSLLHELLLGVVVALACSG